MKKFVLKYRILFIVVLQVCIILGAFYLAFLARFDLRIPEKYSHSLLVLPIPLLVIKMAVFWYHGLFRGWWRYVSMADLLNISKGNLIASMGFTLYIVLVYRLGNFPRSILLLDGVFCFLMMGGVRFITRAYREDYLPLRYRERKACVTRVVIVGAGQAGQMIAREIRYNPKLPLGIVGFIDDDCQKQKQLFQGIPVLGKIDRIAELCSTYKVDEIIITIPSATGIQMRNIVKNCQKVGIKFKTLPGVGQLIDGKVSLQKIKDVEVEDLLGRDAVSLDVKKIETYIKGKRILISGAGGSIGCEICRQIAQFGAHTVILLDIAETALFNIERELLQKYPEANIVSILGDVRDSNRISKIFSDLHPEVVFHAAAYKHVPMMEMNPAEAVTNNILGTKTIADTAHAFKVGHFVMISTDKAVNPVNIMGTTKRVAELYIQGLAQKSNTRFVTVRFGNVLGSNGSVVPIFRQQIANGGPLTVTHPDVTRYFMTIPEAAQLVVQAGCMGKGKEIFILKMGEPVRILTLAENMITLSGFRPYEDIAIEFTELRPGEKLVEELLTSGEGVVPTGHKKIVIAKPDKVDLAELEAGIKLLFQAAKNRDVNKIQRGLRRLVPEYKKSTEYNINHMKNQHAVTQCGRALHPVNELGIR